MTLFSLQNEIDEVIDPNGIAYSVCIDIYWDEEIVKIKLSGVDQNENEIEEYAYHVKEKKGFVYAIYRFFRKLFGNRRFTHISIIDINETTN